MLVFKAKITDKNAHSITVHIVECYEKLVWQFSHSVHVCCAFVTRNKYAAIHKASRAYNSVALVK